MPRHGRISLVVPTSGAVGLRCVDLADWQLRHNSQAPFISSSQSAAEQLHASASSSSQAPKLIILGPSHPYLRDKQHRRYQCTNFSIAFVIIILVFVFTWMSILRILDSHHLHHHPHHRHHDNHHHRRYHHHLRHHHPKHLITKRHLFLSCSLPCFPFLMLGSTAASSSGVKIGSSPNPDSRPSL